MGKFISGKLKCPLVSLCTLKTISLNPGRVDPSSPAWEETRKPLVAAWQTVSGERFFTVNIHMSSKRDSSSVHGDARPPVNGHSERRTQQVNVTAVRPHHHPSPQFR